ncbi:hypothetical protein ACFLTS_01035 [Chloroflexota bacterium]
MVKITDPAKDELKNILSLQNSADPEICLRLIQTAPGQFDLTADKEKEDDQVIEHQGSKMLLVGKELADILDGLTIDCEDSPEGPSLIMFGESDSCNCDECREDQS